MKAIFKKNQIIITALAIMIMIAGYLNFAGNGDSDNEGDALEAGTNESTYSDAGEENILAEFDDSVMTDNYEPISLTDTGDIYSPDEGMEEAVDNSNTGEAILVSTVISDGYFASAKLTREQVRAKNKELLMSIIESADVTDEQKNEALNSIIEMTETSELENATELLLEAKGFDGVVVSIVDDSVDVVVNCDSITEQQIAQIEDIVTRKAGVDADCIVISAVIAQD